MPRTAPAPPNSSRKSSTNSATPPAAVEPGTARGIMRSYGLNFKTLEGEVPEPGDVPATPAIPPVP